MIDDGSTDNSAVICTDYCKYDNRFKYFKKSNGGQADARNYGIELANGEFIGFVDQDDLIHNKMYEILINDAVNNKADVSAIMYKSDHRNYNDIILSLSDNIDLAALEKYETIDDTLIAVTRLNHTIAGMVWNKIYSKKIIGSLRFDINVPLVEDFIFSIDLFSSINFVTTFRNMSLYHWVQHDNNQSHNAKFFKIYRAT